MFPEYLDYPVYKEKYPNKTMREWMNYSKEITLVHLELQYEKYKNKLTVSECREIEEDIKRMKIELSRLQ